MELPKSTESNICSERLQNVVKSLAKWKIDYLNDKKDCKKLRELNVKMELELKEARELEKSNRCHLQSSREMIGNLQETVSQLVYLKRDVKKLKDEITSKDITIANIKRDNETLQQKHKENIEDMSKKHEKHIEDLITLNQNKNQQVQYDLETQMAQCTCMVEELRRRIRDMEEENRDKMNVVVLEYEEKVQRSNSEIAQLKDKLATQTARSDANKDAYRRKIDDLEEKLKQNQFKEYLAQNSFPSQIENKVERPYSMNRDYADSDMNTTPQSSSMPIYSKQKPTLQVMYDTRNTLPKNDKKCLFNITKKRKLYSEKDFLNQ